MKLPLFFLLLFASVAAGAAGAAGAEPYTPKPGSAERKAILDAIREPVQKHLQQSVRFRIDHFKVADGWAFIKGQARTEDDKAIDYSKTSESREAELADELLVAILRNSDGKWQVVKHDILTYDMWWMGMHEELGAPIEIFDYADEPGRKVQ